MASCIAASPSTLVLAQVDGIGTRGRSHGAHWALSPGLWSCVVAVC